MSEDMGAVVRKQNSEINYSMEGEKQIHALYSFMLAL